MFNVYGSDTTCSIFGHGYHAITNEKLPTDAVRDVFYNINSTKDDIERAGETLMMSLYNSKCPKLNEQSYLSYCRKVGSGGVKKKQSVNPATLPPTSDACKQHSFRAYHQVQAWLGRMNNPLEYGW